MKAVAITSLAFVASVHAAGWNDAADPAKSTTTTKPVELTSTWEDAVISKTTTTTKPAEETQSYWGDEEVVESTTTCTYDPEETPIGGEGEDDEHVWEETVVETTTVWSDVPSVETTATVWSDAPAPSKPVEGGKGDPVWSDAGDKWTTTTATGTVTETKWIDVAPSSPVADVDGGKTWEDAPAVPTDVSPASSSSWADYVASTPAADSCVISVITKYGKPTWTPDSEVPATWVDASIPASETSVPATWVDASVPASETSAPATWVDASIPASETSAPATWAEVPAPSDPAVWSDCGVPQTVTEEVTITYTVTDEHWSDVAIVTSSDPVADHTWADVPAEPTEPADDDKPVYGGHGKPSTPADDSDKPVHGGKGKPTTTTTTTPAVETETKTWGDAEISSKTTTEPTKETTTTWSKPSKPTDPVKDIPTTTKPTSGEETQAYWGDAQ